MPDNIDFKQLENLATALLAKPGPGRQIIAITGAPGSGKSTLVERLADTLGMDAAILPMDGFHYDDAVLEQMGRRPWKGAPDTYDVGGLRNILARLRNPDEGEVAVPVFDRDLEISRGSARIIGPDARLILVEGNYLLLNIDPWPSLRPAFDLTIRIEVPEPELRRRLTRRWQSYGLTEAEIAFKLDKNDLPNGHMVVSNSAAPDHLMHVK